MNIRDRLEEVRSSSRARTRVVFEKIRSMSRARARGARRIFRAERFSRPQLVSGLVLVLIAVLLYVTAFTYDNGLHKIDNDHLHPLQMDLADDLDKFANNTDKDIDQFEVDLNQAIEEAAIDIEVVADDTDETVSETQDTAHLMINDFEVILNEDVDGAFETAEVSLADAETPVVNAQTFIKVDVMDALATGHEALDDVDGLAGEVILYTDDRHQFIDEYNINVADLLQLMDDLKFEIRQNDGYLLLRAQDLYDLANVYDDTINSEDQPSDLNSDALREMAQKMEEEDFELLFQDYVELSSEEMWDLAEFMDDESATNDSWPEILDGDIVRDLADELDAQGFNEIDFRLTVVLSDIEKDGVNEVTALVLDLDSLGLDIENEVLGRTMGYSADAREILVSVKDELDPLVIDLSNAQSNFQSARQDVAVLRADVKEQGAIAVEESRVTVDSVVLDANSYTNDIRGHAVTVRGFKSNVSGIVVDAHSYTDDVREYSDTIRTKDLSEMLLDGYGAWIFRTIFALGTILLLAGAILVISQTWYLAEESA